MERMHTQSILWRIYAVAWCSLGGWVYVSRFFKPVSLDYLSAFLMLTAMFGLLAWTFGFRIGPAKLWYVLAMAPMWPVFQVIQEMLSHSDWPYMAATITFFSICALHIVALIKYARAIDENQSARPTTVEVPSGSERLGRLVNRANG